MVLSFLLSPALNFIQKISYFLCMLFKSCLIFGFNFLGTSNLTPPLFNFFYLIHKFYHIGATYVCPCLWPIVYRYLYH